MRVAAAQYPVQRLADFAAFAAKQRRLLQLARAQGAELAVLPEYLALELAGLLDEATVSDVPATLAALQPLHAGFVATFATLARELGLHIVAGSFLLEHAPGRFRNRSYWFTPSGTQAWQDKLTLTGFEHALGVVEPGDTLNVFNLGALRAGVSVCYDCEFPLLARAQVEAGARLLLVPSCTDTEAGASRVRIGCQARALEQQIYVVQAVTAGDAPWNPALDTNTGAATIYGPVDRGFPDDGVLARAATGEAWAYADLDFARLDAVRREGQVANDRDWPSQLRPGLLRPRVLPLP